MERSRTVVGVDIAKRVFQLHWVETETGELMKLRLTRAKFLEHFANRAPCLVGMEACGGAQHWARQLLALGHEVRLLPAKMVRPFVRGNKNDSRDAEAIWTAVQQPGTKTVAVKTEEQQGILALHRHAPAAGEVSHCPDQRPPRPVDRVRRGDAPRPRRAEAGHTGGSRARLGTVAGDGRRDAARAVGPGRRPRRGGGQDRAAPHALAPSERCEPTDRGDPGGLCNPAEVDHRIRLKWITESG